MSNQKDDKRQADPAPEEPPAPYIETTEDEENSSFEKCAMFLCWLLVVIFFPYSLCCCIIVVPEYCRLIILRLGRLRHGAKGPGLVFNLPCIDEIQEVDMRTDVYDVLPQEVITKDSVTITVNAVIYYCIDNVIDSIIQVEDVYEATMNIAKVSLRNIVGSKTLNVLLTSRQALSREIQQAVAGITARWGVRVERVDIMEISLPSNLKRSLASEAQAVREARAKTILAEGEAKASKALKEASDVMTQNHITLQLRHLQILSSLASKKRVYILFPVPLDIMEPFLDKTALVGDDPEDGSDDLSGYFTPKLYIEGMDSTDATDYFYDPEDIDSAEDGNDKNVGNAQPSPSKKSDGDSKPQTRTRGQQTSKQTSGATGSEHYALLARSSYYRSSQRSPRSPSSSSAPTRTTLPPIPPNPTLPPIPNPPPRPPPPKPSLPPDSKDKSNLKADQNYYF